MEKSEFDKLPKEHKLEYIKIELGLFTESVRRRMEILPSASALSAMLLIVATFGDKIVPYNTTVKILLSLLLTIIPVSLFFYNLDLKKAQEENMTYIDRLLGVNSKEEIDKNQNKLDKFVGLFPDFIIYLLGFIVAMFIFSIWANQALPQETRSLLTTTEEFNLHSKYTLLGRKGFER